MDFNTLYSGSDVVTKTMPVKFDFTDVIDVPSGVIQGRANDMDDTRGVMVSSKEFVGQIVGNQLRIDAPKCPAFWLMIDINAILKLIKET